MTEANADALLRSRPDWSAEAVLGTRPFDPKALCDRERAVLTDLFETDAASEFDARNLYDHLKPRMASFPDPVRSYLSLWRDDEENHYRGLRLLLSVAADRPLCEIDAAMAERPSCFDLIEPFLEDPFRMLVAFAYDERVTVQAYAVDYPVYDALGPSPGRWVRMTNRDEALHYRNAVHLVRRLYAHRLGEVSDILADLLRHDNARKPYQATFLLDHDDGSTYFTSERLQRCAEVVERAFAIG